MKKLLIASAALAMVAGTAQAQSSVTVYGLIDAGYRGEIKAKIRNFNQNSENLNCGKFFQIVSPDLKPIQVKIVKELSTTARDAGGFGSTNKV